MAQARSPVRAPDAAVSRSFVALAAVTWVLLVFGASVRVHGAGLACPDWPLCFGELVPQLDFGIVLEWGHRALAGTISLGFVAMGAYVLARADLRARAGVYLYAAAATLAVQVVLGGLTVLETLAFWSVTLHLLAGNLFFVLLALTALALRGSPAPVQRITRATRGLSVALVFALVLQMGLGGLVSSNFAGLACTEWPTCNAGLWFPAFDGAIGLQIAHRLGAYTLLALAVAFYVAARPVPGLRWNAGVLLGLVLLQAGLGITNVWLRLPVEIAIAHSALADLIVLATTLSVHRALRHPVAAAVARELRQDIVAEGA